ncbi:hypothetical protein RB594_007716 [Gaeumannomyces avenae]
MSDSERSPLLSSTVRSTVTAATSPEATPLLSSPAAGLRYDGDEDAASVTSTNASLATSLKSKRRRWPSIIAIGTLALLAIAIMMLAFFVPTAVEQYAKEAAVLEPTHLSIESITSDGVRARIQANFRLDGSRVKDAGVRRVGRLATWAVRQLGTEATKVDVYLPEFDGFLLGSAGLPPLVLNLVDGHTTSVDILADLTPGDAEGIRTIANKWLRGKLDTIRFRGVADVTVKSGLIPLGTHSVSESLVIEAKELPQVPEYNITKLNFKQTPLPGRGTTAIAADVAISAFNSLPVEFNIPELGFDVLVPNCDRADPYIIVAAARTHQVTVRARSDVVVEGWGTVEHLPDALTAACPGSGSSPLDLLLDDYLSGDSPTVYVRGAQKPLPGTPDWISEILASVTIKVPFPSAGFDNLIRDFSLDNVHFTMPDPMAEPDSPDANPKVSGTILVSAGLPSEMNFEVNVTSIRANADVFYKGNKLGELNLEEWQRANSTQEPATKHHEATLRIQSRVDDAPLNVTDGDVLTDVIQALFMGSKPVELDIKAAVSVKIRTVLGDLTLKDVPAEGTVPVKPLPKGTFGNLDPKVNSIRITETSYTSVSIEALINVTNPTEYTADIPFVNIHVMSNGSLVAEATAEDLRISTGVNTNLRVTARWKPSMGGDQGVADGRNLISSYLSGYNTTLMLKTHNESFPFQPLLGEALSRVDLNISTPRLKFPPGKDGDESKRFIRDATFHVLSSTAVFTLLSPLERNTLYIDGVNATAFYNHTDPVGTINYSSPFAVPSGSSQTPRLPVGWRLGSDGYEKLRQALGGRLKLDARADVAVRLGNWRETLWYEGRGIGADIRL